MLQALLYDRVTENRRWFTEPPGDGGTGAASGLQVTGEAFDVAAADGEQRERTWYQVVKLPQIESTDLACQATEPDEHEPFGIAEYWLERDEGGCGGGGLRDLRFWLRLMRLGNPAPPRGSRADALGPPRPGRARAASFPPPSVPYVTLGVCQAGLTHSEHHAGCFQRRHISQPAEPCSSAVPRGPPPARAFPRGQTSPGITIFRRSVSGPGASA